MKAIDYAKMACDTIMESYTVEELPTKGRFHYIEGVFLSGMEQLSIAIQEETYYNYIRKWVDYMILPDASIRFYFRDKLDDLQPAVLLFELYRRTGDERYRSVMDRFAGYLERWWKTPEGGFWHMYNKPNQMWLDGLYMAGSFLVRYAREFDKPAFFDVMHQQMMLMWNHMRDEKTGLLYHAWDSSRQAEWADPQTGLSSEFWGRSIGWVALIVVDMLDFLPQEYPKRADFVRVAQELLTAVAAYQNEKNGLWYQVVDQVDRYGNWTETSCSALFTYALAKAVRNGYIGEAYRDVARKGYEGVIRTLSIRDGRLYLPGICVGTPVGDYELYINRPTEINDLHGVGAFVMMCMEYDRMEREE